MNVGSLFSGIGGFDLGLERAGMRVVWQCEQDEFCRRVLARHWPGIPCHPDVRALVADAESGRCGPRGEEGPAEAGADDRPDDAGERGIVPVPVPHVDILCGGFPCQDISLAGKGAGIDGERSGLWGEYARLIRELRPRYVIVENVAALLGRGLERVLGDLAACGYDAEWDCIPAAAVGAPHRRDRLWIVAYPNSDTRRCEAGSELDSEPKEDPADRDSRRRHADRLRDEVANAELARLEGHRDGTLRSGPVAGSSEGVADADTQTRAGARSSTEALPEPGAVERPGRRGSTGGDVQDADGSALQSWRVGGRAAQAGGSEWWAVEPPVGRVAHGVPDRLDQLASLGNALVPQIAEWLGRRILEHEAGRMIVSPLCGRDR